MDTIFVDTMRETDYDAGPKARNDVAFTLKKEGFREFAVYDRKHGKVGKALDLLAALTKMSFAVKGSKIVVIQYPYGLKAMELMLKRLKNIKKKNDLAVVILIHDVSYLRQGDGRGRYKDLDMVKKREIGIFNMADVIISHNPAMTRSLKENGVYKKIVDLGPFDYLYEGPFPENAYRQERPGVVFAGNLSRGKSRFLYELNGDSRVQFFVYGTKQEELPVYLDYCGSYPPNQLIAHLKGNYGLVWDGDRADTCHGYWGEYLRYNCPHKFSLYIAAGLPVIVWEQSAMAPYVREQQLGICIKNLNDLGDTLSEISEEQYRKMAEAVRRLQVSLVRGEQIKEAVGKIRR